MKKLLLLVLLILCSTQIAFINAQIIATYAGNGSLTASGDGGQAINAGISSPNGIALDLQGNLYIASPNFYNIRKVTTNGVISTIAGNGTSGSSGDGGPATSAQINVHHGIAVDNNGNIYFSEQINHKIRKINTSGIISTYAGTGAMGFSGDGSLATSAKLNNPIGICVDGIGNLYVADANNHRIRKISTSGIITTIAGNGTGGYSGDGFLAINAKINVPEGVAVDLNGNVYLTDGNYTVRKINTSGIISTVAGNTLLGFAGDGGLATNAKISAKDVKVDSFGNLYLVDFLYHVIRLVKTDGVISTIAGQDGIMGFSGDGGNPLLALFNYPYKIAVDQNCDIYISDLMNYRVRKITNSGCYVGIRKNYLNNAFNISPNPSNGQFTFEGITENLSIEVTDLTGRIVYTDRLDKSKNSIDLQGMNSGLYLYKLRNKQNQVQQGKMILE